MSDRPSGGPLPDETEGLPEDEIEEAGDAEEGGDATEDGQTGDDGADGEDAGSEGDDEEKGPSRDVEPRRESRPQRLRRENQELRERLARLEGAGSASPQQPVWDPQAQQRAQAEEQAFRESLEMMSPGQAALAVEQRANMRFSAA